MPRPFLLRFKPLAQAVLFTACVAFSAAASCEELQIPDLGDAGGGMMSPAEEYELGQKVLRIYRSNLPTSNDPFFEVYLESLLQKLVTYSAVKDKRLELLVIEDKNLNAFAAPGGIVGVNTGTFL
ncbi:MAG TPA: M48 family peptidase, partial [Cellvibrionaceae bacterium]|nr:M48 family peptidase [Cellvibrionaceae bacterium]